MARYTQSSWNTLLADSSSRLRYTEQKLMRGHGQQGWLKRQFKVEGLMLLLRLRIARLLLLVVRSLTLDMPLKVNEHLERR
jgi:hypothetical protein